MLDRKKVLYLITKSNWGGAQRYVYDIATTLPHDRFESVVALGGANEPNGSFAPVRGEAEEQSLSSETRQTVGGTLARKLTEAGIRIIPIPSLQRDISLAKELGSFREIWDIVKRERPDVLHVNSSKAGGIGALVGRLTGVPKIIYSAHGWSFNEARNPLARFVIAFFHWLTVMFAHVTIAVSNATKHQMQWPFAQRKIVVVHNGRPAPDFLDRDRARAKCIELEPRLVQYRDELWTGTIAELHPIKRHDLMIESVAKLKSEGITLRHIIIGDGDERAVLERQIEENGLSEQVFLLGHVADAAALLRAFDVFVLTSRSEAFGYTIVEAAQAGAAIVATRVGGIPEIITDGWDGILVPPNDAAALTDTLKAVTENAELRQKLQRAAKVRGQHFSLEKMVVDTTAVYNI